MSLYTLDGTTRKLLRLETFGAPDFSVRSFIEQLRGSQGSSSDDARLDPKPYIRTFECAATELERLHQIALDQEENAKAATAQLSESHNLEIHDIATNVQECVKEVKALDEVTTEISQTTGRMSQKLDRISHQHAQISDFRALISAYLSFLSGKQPTELTRLWQTDVRKCALFTSQLQTLAMAIGPIEGKPDVQKQIDKYAEDLENQLLANFLESYHSFNLPGMRESADILFEFNGGGSVVQAYINQHRFFMNVQHLQPEQREDDQNSLEGMWLKLRDPHSKYKEFSDLIDKAVSEITETIARETEIITKVFSRPAQVLSMFIQRTFAQKIQELVTRYIEEAAEQPETLPQVRVLSVCYIKINELVTDLQKVWSHQSSGLSDAEQIELGAVLESNFTDAFVLYIDDYFSLEEVSLNEIISKELAGRVPASKNGGLQRSASATSSAQKNDDGHMERLRRAMRNFRYDEDDSVDSGSSQGRAEHDSASNAGVAGAGAGAGANSGAAGAAGANTTTTGTSSDHLESGDANFGGEEISVVNLTNVLAAFAEAISREQILRSPDDFPSDATALYNLLSREIGGRYISATIDNALSLSQKLDPRGPIDWSLLQSIKISGHGLRLVSAFVKTVLFAMVQSTPETQQNMADALNLYILNVQKSCLRLIEEVADLMHSRTRALFAKNSKRDFMEPAEESVLDPDILEELVNLAGAAKEYLSHENSHKLLSLVAQNFCDDLLVHLQQFTISIAGGLALSNDIAEYERLMTQDWGLSGEVTEKLATLRAIGRLFTADQSLLSSLLRDSHLSKLGPNHLRQYLGQRADNSAKMMATVYFHNNLHYRNWY